MWTHLAWFSLGGNGACAPAPPKHDDLVFFSQEDIDLDASGKLGDGASGEVFSAILKDERLCAIKVFKSDVSPDGQTSDEVDLSSGIDHPNITRVIGHLVKEGGSSFVPSALILHLCLGAPLAAKPTSKHLLRCKWDESISYSVGKSVKIALGVASALSYLHDKNIAHGDVYAHNILVDAAGHATLCDFGAAFAYHPRQRLFWERMEVRAFGLFLMDQVKQTSLDVGDGGGLGQDTGNMLSNLKTTAERCLSMAGDRPMFEEIRVLLSRS